MVLITPLALAESSKDSDSVNPECVKVLAELKDAEAQNNIDY